MTRPTGVTVLAGLQFFYSGFGLLTSLAMLLIKPFRDNLVNASMQMLRNNPQFQTTPISAEFFERTLIIAAGAGVFFSLIGLLLGYGLLKLKGWAWICTLILQVLQLMGSLQGLFSAFGARSVPGVSLSQLLFQLVITSVIIYYLFRPDVKRAFGR